MDLQLLGPVEAGFDGRPVSLGPTKQRALLAMLALHANATVGVDRLIDGLWGEDPPATAPKMVQLYVSQLRRVLAGDGAEIVTHGRGYELRVDDEAIDAARFERLVERAGRADGAAEDIARRALALWHGSALADVANEPFASVEIRRLEELWLRAAELAVDGALAAGRCEEALGELERLLAEHPLREHLHAQRMLALYRSGRQAEALDAFVVARRRLVDEIGVEPSAELRELHERILRQDPALRLPPAPVKTQPAAVARATPIVRGPPLGARWFVLAAAIALLVGVAVFALTRRSEPAGLPGIAGGAVGVIDADAAVISHQYTLGFEPGAVTAGDGSVWVADPKAGTVARIPRRGNRETIISVGRNPAGLAFGAGSLWVAGGDDGELVQVDASQNRRVRRWRIGNGLRALAVDYGAVWAATAQDGEVVRVDLRLGSIVKRIAVGGRPIAMAAGAGAVWVVAEDANLVVPIDPRSNQPLAQIGVGNGPSAVAVGLGAVGVANRQDGTVSRIDPATQRVTNTIPAGREPVGLSVAGGSLWVADAAGAVRRVNPDARAVADIVRTGSSPAQLTTAGGDVWAAVKAPPAAHRGGTLRIGWAYADLDPGYAGYDGISPPVLELAYDGLVGYRRESGVAGTRLVGDLATAVPDPADGGRSYTFRLRPGLRFSDGTPVRASDFRASMERMLAEPQRSPPLYNSIEGVARCTNAPSTCDLSHGIVTDDRTGTITLHLRRPDPGLLPNLALRVAAVVPSTAPPESARSRPIPGTGPYRVARIEPGRRILARNPYFRPREGRPAGFADRIEVLLGDDDPHIRAVEREQLDFSPVFTLSARRLAALRIRVGARLQTAANTFTEYAWLNVHARPFDDPRVRLALNLALDRRRLVEDAGGLDSAAPTCQILPPGMPGWRPGCHFTSAASPADRTAPDLARARRLVAASGARGAAVEEWVLAPLRPQADPIARALDQLGFRSRVRVFEDFPFDARRRPQLAVNGWYADSPDSAAFLRAFVSCKPDTVGDDFPHLCGYGVDAAIDRAQAAGPAAGDAWKRIEDLIAAHAPVVPLLNRRAVAVISKRAGNFVFPPLAGAYFEQLWVR